MEKVYYLLNSGALISEKVFYCVHIIMIPLKFEAWWIPLTVSAEIPTWFLLSEKGPIKKIVYAFIVDLHERNVYSYFSLALSSC